MASDIFSIQSLSFERYETYFSSLYLYSYNACIAGLELKEFATWRQWLLPCLNRETKCSLTERGPHGVDEPEVLYSGVCWHLKTSVDWMVHEDAQCTGTNDNLKPWIGTDGRLCAFYLPNDNLLTKFGVSVVTGGITNEFWTRMTQYTILFRLTLATCARRRCACRIG